MNKLLNIINNEIKIFLNENMDMDDWMEYQSGYSGEVFMKINNKEQIKFRLIPRNQYHHALREFVKYNDFVRFPISKILQWKDLILVNIAKLDVLNDIAGHSNNFPYDEFYDNFDYNQDTGEERDGDYSKWCKQMYDDTGDEDYNSDNNFTSAYEFLDVVKKMDDYLPLFSNGAWVLSDFGLAPLGKLGVEMTKTNSPTELIILINKVLDVTHQRSDLAELFIEGGSVALDYISNH